MLTLVLRRALVQRWLLAAVVLLIAASASLLGVCSLLLGVTQDRAFHEEIERSQPQDLEVSAYLVDLSGDDLAQAREQAQRVVSDILAPMQPTVTATATAPMRRVGDTDRLAYLQSDDGLAERADLTSGRWPAETSTGPLSAAVPDATARLLDLALGDQVTLGEEVGPEGVETPVTVVVVGTFRPHSRAGWETDPLAGAGVDADYSDGAVTAPAYGPFAVADASFVATGSSVAGLRVTARPTLSLADESSLRVAANSIGGASALLSSRVGDLAGITRVGSDLPQTLDRIRAQQATARATVLVVLLLAAALSVAAALLAGRLVASVREDERALLVAIGLSRRQRLGAALLEASALAATAALLAVPAASVAHSLLTHLPDVRAADLTQSPTVTWGLVLAVLAGVVLFTVVLVITAQTERAAVDPTARRWTVVRAGLDVLLLAVAVAGWWQLRSPPPTDATRGDLALTVAPVLCLAAATVVAVRLVPLLLATSTYAAVRSPGLVMPLAIQQAARRPRAGTAMALVAAAVAGAVFGLSLHSTWSRSQDDQATVRVGTDLSLMLLDPAGPQEAAAVAQVAAADESGKRSPGIVSVAVDRPLALGRYVGDAATRPVLVAVDTRHAGALLRGRMDAGNTWAQVGARLAPRDTVRGLPLAPDAGAMAVEGSGPAGAALTVTPTVVVQDALGYRRSVVARPLALDGRPHPVEWRDVIGSDLRLVAVRLDVDGAPGGKPGTDRDAKVSVTLRIPGPAGQGVEVEPSWRVRSLQTESPVSGAVVSVNRTDAGAEVRSTSRIDLTYLEYTGAALLVTEFATPPEVPVAVSQALADAVGTKVGGRLSAIVDGTALQLRVTAVVPTVPSAPGQVAVLADADTLSRALIGAGSLDPVVDGWWVGHPAPATAGELRALQLGEVTTRDQAAVQLAQGPLRVTVPAALLTLVVAAGAMLLAGVLLILSSERQRRSVEVARWRAIGLTRQDARRLLLVEHGAFLAPLILVGALVGAAAAVLLAPHMIRSDVGAAPVPAALVSWPWAAEAVLVGGLLLGTLAIATVMTAHQVRRSDPAMLRGEDA